MSAASILLTVQTGMVARDLLRCGPLDQVLRHPLARVVLLTSGVRDPAFRAEFEHERVQIEEHLPYEPSRMVWRIMERRWRYARSARLADTFHRLEERLLPEVSAYAKLFRRYRPALVVSGDPLRPGDAQLVAMARRRDIPTLGSVRSWDNVLKHLRTRPDALTVWNRRNVQEAVEVDRVSASRVTAVGAPQLDHYFAEQPPPSREAFCHVEGLDPSRKILVLATSSFTYGSDQTYLVDMVLDALRSGAVRHRAQIVLRLHPDDRVGRYLKYRHAPEISLDIPESYFATLGWTMTRADLTRTAWLLHHADVMVNFATTLTLEAAITDTPTLLVAFSPIDPAEMERYVVGLHFKLHYRDIVQRDLAPVAWNRDDLIGWINRYLEDPASYRAERQTIVRDWVEFTDGRSGQRLGDAILHAAGLGSASGAGRLAGPLPVGARG
ncbi:MAG: CDP-glycerol glycerophosphotransferase family protein, partial [Chloroflexi bacterium]|nr:CDP-glycerol glycerophosphotransferase family protein [Chloroflexota bacterium]